MSQLALHEAALAMIKRRGASVMVKTTQKILNTTYDNGILDSALNHYVKVNLSLVNPLFPALMSLSYETAKGCKDDGKFDSVSVAMSLIAFSADIHDDVIDQSVVKYAKKTVYGKFGSEIALLAGDNLLIQGHALLHQACEVLSLKQRSAISMAVSKALFELSASEALDVQLSKKTVIIDPDEYFGTMCLRGVFAELHCRIGGILGQASDEMLDILACFGRTIGMLGTVQDEFSDMYDASELKHRIKFECPPLPMVYALYDKKVKTMLKELVEQIDASRTVTTKITKLVLNSQGVCSLKHKLGEQVLNQQFDQIINGKNPAGQDMSLLLQAFSSFNY
jgi:geranylgeranyl pyrophosphate synthase